MSTTNLLDTKTVTLNEILGNGKIYRVPQFQRDYSWDQDNWEDLWNDLCYAYEKGEAHYMGSIVLQIAGNESDKNFWIIDGQQRFTTLSILTLAAISKIRDLAAAGVEPEHNSERADLLMRQYIGQKDPSSLMYSSKLFLNENNDGFYQQRLLNFRPPIHVARLSDSEKALWRAFLYFRQQIDELFSARDGAAIASFLSRTVGELLKFIQIVVRDELNAYTVFETLNSRGVELTATDLLKNYLFALVAKSRTDLDIVKGQWKRIIDAIGLKEFPVFLRYYLNTRLDLITKNQLFKAVKKFVSTDQHVMDLLDHLEMNAYIYTALSSPDDVWWNGDKEAKEYVGALKLFRVSLCSPLLMVACEKLPATEFKRVLSAVAVLSFRYNVIGTLQTNDMEKVYNKVAQRIYKGELLNAYAIIQALRPLYVEDEAFRSYFVLKSFPTNNNTQKKIVRYILYNIEGQLPGGARYDYETDEGTIEHILPECMRESNYWNNTFTEDEHTRAVYMLGNMTLLEPSKNNKEASNKPMPEKVQVYATSQYALTADITDQNWTMKMIAHRQERLAKLAAAVWKL